MGFKWQQKSKFAVKFASRNGRELGLPILLCNALTTRPLTNIE